MAVRNAGHPGGRRAVAMFAILVAIVTPAPAATVVEPGHTLILHADSATPIDPTQSALGLNNGATPTGIESITVDDATGIIYVQVIDPVRSCPSTTTAIYAIDPATGGLTTVVNANTAFGVCERGSDIDLAVDSVGAQVLVCQNEFGAIGPELATVDIASGIAGTWTTGAPFAGNTFGMQLAPGIGAVPAGDVLYVADVGGGINSAPSGGPNTFLAPDPGGGGDDLFIQPDGDIVFIGDFATGIWVYDPFVFFPVLSALPDVQAMFAGAALGFTFGTRSTVCTDTGQAFISFSGDTGGTGVFRVNNALTAATLLMTTAADEGIHDISIGRPSSGTPGQSLYLTIENFTSGAHQVWELTNVCKRIEPKWSQPPHDMNEGFNVPSDVDWVTLSQAPIGTPGPGPNQVVADDFVSDGRIVSCVRWWGSYVDPTYEPGPGAQPIDGWLFSFHTDLLGLQPDELIGLYFCRAEDVVIRPLDLFGWDGHRVYEYFVELEDCCLVHARLDQRDSSFPARPDGFRETLDSIYWLDIQAVVGHTIQETPIGPCVCDCDVDNSGACDVLDLIALLGCLGNAGCPDINCDGVTDIGDVDALACRLAGFPPEVCCRPDACTEIATGNFAAADFWGWHTSPAAFSGNSTMGVLLMAVFNDWQYGPWMPVDGTPHMLPRVDQAFELLTPYCPADCEPPGGDGQVDVADLLTVLAKWGTPPPQECDVAPSGGDDIVDVADLLKVLADWGPCP